MVALIIMQFISDTKPKTPVTTSHLLTVKKKTIHKAKPSEINKLLFPYCLKVIINSLPKLLYCYSIITTSIKMLEVTVNA